MKRLIIITGILIFMPHAMQIRAQSLYIKGGFNMSRMFVKFNGTDTNTMYQPGFHIGAIIDYPSNDLLSLETGLFLTTRGEKTHLIFNLGVPIGRIDNSEATTLYYLDLPIRIRAAYNVGKRIKIFAVAGPHFDFGLAGKMKSTAKFLDTVRVAHDKRNIKWGKDYNNDQYERFDTGLSFGGGLKVSSVLFDVTYNMGLYDISPLDLYGETVKNRNLEISVGYRFGN